MTYKLFIKAWDNKYERRQSHYRIAALVFCYFARSLLMRLIRIGNAIVKLAVVM
ncbi:MAG: hypothetical protein RI996_546 [Candidatus Parcubacteria bacterium]|jgi:hypothetical protein